MTKSFNLLSYKNSTLSDLTESMILLPLEILGPSSSTTEKVPPAVDYHLHWLSSSWDFEMTVTLSATKKAE